MSNKIKEIFKAKKIEFSDLFEEAKYLLSYRVTLFLSITLLILTIIFFNNFNIENNLITLIGFLLSLFMFFFIHKTGKYYNFIFIVNIFGAILCIISLFIIKEVPRIVEGFWMLVNILLAFYTIKKKWAYIIGILHSVTLFIFHLFFLNEQIYLLKNLSNEKLWAVSSNILICFSVTIYLLWQNTETTKKAQEKIKKINEKLEDKIKLTNAQHDEKVILLKEIHHRVKNNLQVIISLLRLQSENLNDIKSQQDKFKESIDRVHAMAMIHEKIYQNEDFTSLNIKDYLSTLANEMINSYRVEKKIELVIDSTNNSISLKPIVPIALIFNELLSNSIKYAFQEVNTPIIEIYFHYKNEDDYVFTYKDNGKWKTPEKEKSFGIELIETLTEQLNGSYNLDTSKGTKYEFYFDKLNA